MSKERAEKIDNYKIKIRDETNWDLSITSSHPNNGNWCTGNSSRVLGMWLRELGMPYSIERLQQITLLGLGRILCKCRTLNIQDRRDGKKYPRSQAVTGYSERILHYVVKGLVKEEEEEGSK